MASLKIHKRLTLIAGGTIALVLFCFGVLIVRIAKPKSIIDADEVWKAVRNFNSAHQSLPTTVTFSQLIAEGHLEPNALKRIGASEVSVFLRSEDGSPRMYLMDALMPDGTHITLLSDGSVQGLQNTTSNKVAP